MKIGSLFSGYGGLDLGVRAELGGEIVWHCETDPAACRVLAHHWPNVPNLMDITSVDWSAVPAVDVITGGFPCTDVSSAGKRAGMRPGTRSALWTHMAHAISELRPSLVVIENVRGLLSAHAVCDLEPCPWCLGDERDDHLRALGAVLGDLAVIGYDAQWVGVRASDVGAPHGRFRIFIVARDTTSAGSQGCPGRPVQQREPGAGCRTAAESESIGRDQRLPGPAGIIGRPDVVVHGDAAADTAGAGRETRRGHTERSHLPEQGLWGSAAYTDSQTQWGDYAPAIRRWERILGRPAPAPTQDKQRGDGQQLSPRFVEWLMGLDGHVTSVPGLSRNEMLRVLGNGVVPQQAQLAVRWLAGSDMLRTADHVRESRV